MKWTRSLALLMALAASAETIHFRTLPREVIEKRLAVFGSNNGARQKSLRDLFAEAGCATLTDQPVKGAAAPNLICVLPGQMDATILTGAHFDFVNKGQGVVDNWSGASLLPSLFESLKAQPRRHTFVFVGFTDEEKGLVGSKFYVRKLSKQDLGKVSAMVNIDSLGMGTTKLETDRGDKRMTSALADIAATFKLPLSVVNAHAAGFSSDSDSFQDRKIPSINIHTVTNETLPVLHSEKDTMEAIHIDEYYDSYRLLAAYLAYLDLKFDPVAESR